MPTWAPFYASGKNRLTGQSARDVEDGHVKKEIYRNFHFDLDLELDFEGMGNV